LVIEYPAYPFFFSGRGLIAVVFVRGVTWEDLNSWPEFAAALLEARSFESLNNFCAALAVLLGLFFGFDIALP
jgi:hypothetical protein